MANEIISRAIARAKGLSRYYTGKPCKKGHVAERIFANGTCVVCYEATITTYRKNNSERIKVTDNAHRNRNLEKHRGKDRKYRIKYNSELRERDKERYARTPRELLRKHRRDRKARQKGASGSHTLEQLERLFDKQKRKCVSCLDKLALSNRHLDHITPLSRGGSNAIDNLQWLCVTCNLRKHAKDPFVWAQENGRLL